MVLAFPTGESQFVNYDWNDISEGTGYIRYYGYKWGDASGSGYALSTQVLEGTSPTTTASFTSAAVPQQALTKVIDLDFDLPLNVPKIVQGKVLVSMSSVFGDASHDESIHNWIFKVRKYSGTTESDLAQVATSPTTSTQDSTNYVNGLFHITVPRTHFKKNDVIRITVEGWASKAAAAIGESNQLIYHDPQNTAVTSVKFTTLKFYIPFVLDL